MAEKTLREIRDEAVKRFAEGMDLPLPLLNCENTQCRVHNFRPHRAPAGPGNEPLPKPHDSRCPGCYGMAT